MTPTVAPSPSGATAADRLRRLYDVYAAGTGLWTLALFAAVLGHDADVRQVLVLLALLASFGALWLWSAWRLWTEHPGPRHPRRSA
ncbi:hypothetical protein [Streptomyces sp. NPDC018610]|jgi:hypothetical protein|uniref:hypothetical protein n=1 Tax=Streptomyces sp. NPDC018610 TaxID=3365049 RepID=UPI00378C6784